MSSAEPQRYPFMAYIATPRVATVTVINVAENGEQDNVVVTEKLIASLRVAGALFVLFLALLGIWWVTGPIAGAQTVPGAGTAVQQAVNADNPSTAPLLALTGACTALVGAVGVVIRAFVKGDIAPRANAVREEELLKQNALLSRLLEDAAKREDIFYRYIGIHPPNPDGRE